MELCKDSNYSRIGQGAKYIIFFMLTTFCRAQDESIIDYYDKLISDNINRISKYVPPTDYSEFFKISEPNGNISEILHEKYDFIIVGAGAAGGVLANRLSEVDQWKVLLIEAGDFEDNFSDIPDMSIWTLRSERNWWYYTTPQQGAMAGKKFLYHRGKSIGGSTAINGLLYTRGNKKDYNDWAAQGNPGWSYKDVLQYFIKSEKSHIDGDEGYHGNEGPMAVDYVKMEQISALKIYEQALIDSAKRFNLSYVADYNGIKQIGISKVQMNLKNGKRASTGRAYIEAARSRGNLRILTKSFVTKVLVRNSRAYGVKIVRNGKMYNIQARKEVILCGGVINSPVILLQSGIGPKEELHSLNISSVLDLPVGRNFIDQFHLVLVFSTNYSEEITFIKRKEIANFIRGSGVLTNTQAVKVETYCFFNVEDPTSSRPDSEFMFGLPLNLLATQDQVSNNNTFNKFNIDVRYLRPRSRGNITLKSNNLQDYPNINENMFSDEKDIESFYNSIKYVLNLISSKHFGKYNTTLVDTSPQCSKYYPIESKKYWICSIRDNAVPNLHMIGTNRMGPNSKTSVVDNNSRVHGIPNLRIVDASIIPVPISGHTSAPTTMLGEKVSDIIKIRYAK